MEAKLTDNKAAVPIPLELRERHARLTQQLRGSKAQQRYAQFTHELIERIAALTQENADLRAKVAALSAPVSDEGMWIIHFADADREDEVFWGAGASAAALERYRVCCYSWTCTLLCEYPTPAARLAKEPNV